VQELGADETINYREQDFADVYKDKPFDYIFDSVGGKARFAVCVEPRDANANARAKAGTGENQSINQWNFVLLAVM